jgi:Putative L-xylulose-5-phosphate 3-epimerase
MSVYPIGIYEKALYVKKLEWMLDNASRLGFDLFEISVDESDMRMSRLEWNKDKRNRVLRAASHAGIRLFSICFSGHRKYPMGSADPEIEKRAMVMMKQAIGLAYDLGIPVIQMAGYDVFYEPHTEDTAKRFDENLQKSVDMAAGAGIMLSVENVEKYVTSVEKAMELVRWIDSPWLSVYPDVANLYMTGCRVQEEFRKGKGHITAVHVREAPDDVYLPFGQGKLDFDGIFQVLKEIRFHGPLVVELWNQTNPEYENVLTEAIAFLKREMERD